MKKATFENTVDILVKAYLNGILKHSICGCAVHNIIESINGSCKPLWNSIFCTSTNVINDKNTKFVKSLYYGDAKEQIDSTGYTVEELARIEYAFESLREFDDHGDEVDNLFECLMNVIDELAIIHNIDLSVKEEAKLLFVKL